MFMSSTMLSAGNGAAALLDNEAQGLAVDFTTSESNALVIKDNPTGALSYSGTPFLNDGGKLTFSRTSLATVVDDDGLMKWAPHNLVLQSQTFDSATWSKFDVLAFGSGSTANATTAPDGLTTADLITPNTTAGAQHFVRQTISTSGRTTFSVFAKSNGYDFLYVNVNGLSVDIGWINIANGTLGTAQANVTTSVEDVGNGWYKCSWTWQSWGSGIFDLAVASADNQTTWTPNGTDGIYLWGAHLYRSDLGGMQDNGTAFPTYNPTTTAAYYGPRIDHLLASPYTRQGLLMEEARTNIALHNSDLTQAAWVASNITPLKNVTGPDNVANSASRITATAANGTILQTVTLASSARFQSAYVKRITGTGTVEMTTDNGSTWTAITVTADWTRVSIPSQTLADPVFGFRIVTDADAIAVFGVQNENGVFATSMIPVTTASVTRAVDACSIATSLFPYSASTMSAVWSGAYIAGSTDSRLVVQLTVDTSNSIIGSIRSGVAQATVTSAGSAVASLNAGSTSGGTVYKHALAAQLDDFALVRDGGSPVTDTSGAMPSAATAMFVGGNTYSASQSFSGHIRQITYLPRRITNAELQERTS